MERKKRRRIFVPALKALFVIAIVIPVVWVVLYGFIEAPFTILMGQRALQGETVRHSTVKMDDISPHLVRAVLAAEDSQFCRHQGFDTEAIKKAMAANERNKKSGKVRGGSTISQQTAKNLFLWPQRSWVRKGAEAYFTVLTEFFWPKKRIMEAYLNAAEWGDGIFGAEAASQARFGKSAKDLSPNEAARLAAVLPSPNKWNAETPGPYVRRRAASIQARMYAIRNQGLDLCVLDPKAAPPPKPAPKKRPPDAPVIGEETPSIVAEEPLTPKVDDEPEFAVPEEPVQAGPVEETPYIPPSDAGGPADITPPSTPQE